MSEVKRALGKSGNYNFVVSKLLTSKVWGLILLVFCLGKPYGTLSPNANNTVEVYC